MEPARPTHRNNPTNSGTRQELFSAGNTLPGLETSVIHGTEPAMRAQTRMEMGYGLAAALLGHPVELLENSKDSWHLTAPDGRQMVQVNGGLHLVDQLTGEVGPELAPERAARYAALLLRAASPENHLVGILDSGEAGEYLGGAAAWKSSLRLDPNWAETLRRRSRKVARPELHRMLKELPMREQAMRRYPMHNGKLNPRRLTLKLLTLTQPVFPGARTLDQLQVINRAFGLLRKTELWKAAVWGGAKGLEDHLTWKGPDVHAHLLILSRYVDRGPWRRAWWSALNTAWRETYGEGMAHMPAGLPFLDVRIVRKKGAPATADTVSLDEALDETTKYVTKTADLITPDAEGRAVSPGTLLELCDIARWPRMFELFGAARKPACKAGTRLDTSCISDGGLLLKLIQDHQTHALEPEERSLYESEGLSPRSCRSSATPDRWQRYTELPDYQVKAAGRPPTWRDLMAILPLQEWVHLMMGRARSGVQFRIAQIAEQNQRCFLVDMAGKVRIKQSPDLECVPC